ncbi:MAG: hypothetical protein OT477_13320, partial [Chloroflexi bacterium]|nr:hypothetical protein [Chloroflexota bacterium]
WRLTLRVKVKDVEKITEMRAALVNGDQILSETFFVACSGKGYFDDCVP